MQSRLGALTIVAAVLLLGANPGGAASPEGRCQAGRYKAAGKYVACQQTVLGKLFGGFHGDLQAGVSMCRIK